MTNNKSKRKLLILLLIFCLFFTIILASGLGAVSIPSKNVIKILVSRLPFINFLADQTTKINQTIILKIRLPRILLAGLVGLALATSGTIFQALLKNPMADPYIIGISSGASLGATLGIILNLGFNLLGLNTIPVFAFIGAVMTTFIVYHLAKTGRKISTSTLLLAGIAMSSLLSSLVSLLMVFNDNNMHQIVFWNMGSLASAGWVEVKMIWFYILIGYIIIYFFTRELNIILLGEESAQGLGVDVEKTKKILLTVGSLLAGAAVAGSGVIGFIGLIIPHIVRLIVGPDHRILIPASSLAGAIFLIITDTLARTIIAPTEIPVGIITSLLGAPFFIYLLTKTKNTGF